mmetsp:Transcript_18631/g.32355  ORF Transcript_18631/g.32355 Transcript_18631/m.32355 type:complete len:154 (+) Transcript_18631:165-626(+)
MNNQARMCKDQSRPSNTSTSISISNPTAMIPMQLSWDIKLPSTDDSVVMKEDDSSPITMTTNTTIEPAMMTETMTPTTTTTHSIMAANSNPQSTTLSQNPLDLRSIEQSLVGRCESESMDPIQSSYCRTGRSANRMSSLRNMSIRKRYRKHNP